MRLAFDHLMRQPVDRVFAYLADPRNRPKWQRSIREFEMISDGEPRLGMKWRERAIGAPPFEMEIVAFEPGRLWAERGVSPAFEGSLTLRFAEEGGGTRLRIVAEVDLRGWRRLLEPFIRLVGPREIRRDLRKAEALIAQGGRNHPPR